MFSEPEGRSGGSRLGSLFGRLKGAISRWNEVHRLDAPEIETIARELNLSAAELGALCTQWPVKSRCARDLAGAAGNPMRA